jgi:hypothetical protein
MEQTSSSTLASRICLWFATLTTRLEYFFTGENSYLFADFMVTTGEGGEGGAFSRYGPESYSAQPLLVIVR